MLEALGLTIKYGERIAVDNVAIALEEGQFTAVIGPNGSGKSSLVKSLNGHLKPFSGRVNLDGELLQVFSRRAIGRRIAVVAQEAELRFPITVFEFVLGGRFAWSTGGNWGWESRRDVEIAESVIEETRLTKLSNRLMNELSGGERQRAVLARALATEATVLLLDEPTASLDLSHQAMILELVRSRCESHKVSALVVTHDINLAAQFAHNVLLMKDGKAIKFGNPADVLTPELLQEVFEVRVLVDGHPLSGVPRVTPVLERHR